MRSREYTRGLAGAFLVLTLAVSPAALGIETVPVGNPGNPGDPNNWVPPAGGVGYIYRIGKFEVTAGQYCGFLNAVAATDTYGLYSFSMPGSCGIYRSGSPGSHTYSIPDANQVNRPVNYVTFWDTCRFANWLHNGQPTGGQTAGTTETGAYTLNGYNGGDGRAIGRNPGARWWVPNQDEWYKAAYHYNDGATMNYWDYPTSSDAMPNNDLINPDPGNHANYWDKGTMTPYTIGAPYYRTVGGEFENSASPYGTFDQGGNVFEWMDRVGYLAQRIVRGGSYNNLGVLMNANSVSSYVPTHNTLVLGFRVARLDPAMVIRGGGHCMTDMDGFLTGGYDTGGMEEGAIPMPATADVWDLTLDEGLATLVVNYQPEEALALGIDEATLRLYTWNEGGGTWLLAGRGSNIDQTTGQFVAGPPTDILGDWGIDLAGHFVWANIDHASVFASAGVPEPATLALLAAGGLALLSRRRRKA